MEWILIVFYFLIFVEGGGSKKVYYTIWEACMEWIGIELDAWTGYID